MNTTKITSGIIFKYQVKTLFGDKSFIVMTLISLFFTLALSIAVIFIKTTDIKIVIFNYYVLIHTFVIIIINVLKMISFFFNQKREDKTINIIVTQELKRTKLFFITMLVIFTLNSMLFISNFIILNIFNYFSELKIDLTFLRVTLVYLIYSMLILFFLESFIIFLLFTFSTQITTIIMTLIMSFGFISSLPYQFLTTSEQSKQLTFISPQQVSTVQKVEDIYDAIDLQKYVKSKKIAYPNLSYYINNSFLNEKNMFRSDEFSSSTNILKRIDIWKNLGIINNSPVELNFKARIASVRLDSDLKTWSINDVVEVKANLENTFISNDQLEILINEKNENFEILLELQQFTNEIMTYFNSFQRQFYNLFDDFIFLEEGNVENYIKNETKNEVKTLETEYLKDIYQNSFVTLNGLTLRNSEIMPIVEKQMDQGGFFNPLMLSIRILENYFIKYTSNYILSSTYRIETNSADWIAYKKSRDFYNIFFQINFMSNVLNNYTYYAGFSYQDIWFEPDYKSNISFKKQENMFLPYTTYTFKVENQIIRGDSYNNFIPVYFYLIIQAGFALILYCISHYKFKKMDLN
ncbi:ABC transporter permease [Spiroplasma culicicola]|uniref:Uncharacterized protein n=1 Tax=Spiroplasma culicicola AES-1 TaxID=1276246 RepID=W6A7M5_9MOLU|nr:ABC transporter permease [Spiroplasma culicicola]AHI52987.1 hypothetical protein SCULI_v1c06460 [Spiroplasma culicicola AES-1]